MPVEIRELIIKTEINSQPETRVEIFNSEELETLKQQIISECMKSFKDKTRRNSFNRDRTSATSLTTDY